MITELNGLQKDVKVLVQQALNNKDWSVSTASNGQHILKHSCGAVVMVSNGSGGGYNLKNLRSKIRRVEKEARQHQPLIEQVQLIPSEEEPPANHWSNYTSNNGHQYQRRTHHGNWEYRCLLCGKDKLYGLAAAAGHQRMHGPSQGALNRPSKKEPAVVKPPVRQTTPVMPQPAAAPQVLTLAAKITALVEEEMAQTREEINKLKAENKRLRDVLNSLAQLAAEEG